MKELDDDAAARLTAELAALARVRNRLELKVDRFPELQAQAADSTMEAIFESIVGATEGLDEPSKLAADLLLADTPERWEQNLKARSTAAAAHLGIGSYHTFRDRRHGQSPSDLLLSQVAAQILANESEAVAEPADISAEHVSAKNAEIEAHGQFAGRRLAVVAALGVVLLCSAAFAFVRGGDAVVDPVAEAIETTSVSSTVVEQEPTVGASEAIPVDGCDIPLGGSVTPTRDQRAVAEAIDGAVQDAGGIEMTGCADSSIERWQELWVQDFIGDGLPPGSVLTDDAGNALWVEAGVLTGYRNGMSGTLQQISGLPVAFRSEGLTQILELGDGSFVVAEVPGNRAFWIAPEAADDWLAAGGSTGGLGPPLTDPNFIDGRPEQHFRNGRIWEGEPGEAVVELADAAAVDAYLSALGDPYGRLVRTFDSTAWWIDADGVRRWIPDGETWHCLGGADVVLEEETPGWVIGSFAVGPPMNCDS